MWLRKGFVRKTLLLLLLLMYFVCTNYSGGDPPKKPRKKTPRGVPPTLLACGQKYRRHPCPCPHFFELFPPSTLAFEHNFTRRRESTLLLENDLERPYTTYYHRSQDDRRRRQSNVQSEVYLYNSRSTHFSTQNLRAPLLRSTNDTQANGQKKINTNHK